MRIIFAGTPAFAASHLQALIQDNRHQIVGVYTQPDRRAGRGKKLTASPVKILAEKHSLPVYQPHTLREESAQATLEGLAADVMIVVAYGLILPQKILDAPRHGCLNVHASLLPRWRGAAPVQRAIAAGDSITGVTIMQMDAGLDTGDILHTATSPIDVLDNSGTLLDKLAELGPSALLSVLEALQAGELTPVSQDDSQSCYAAKIDKSEALIDWTKDAGEIARLIRAFIPFPVCYSWLDGQRIKLWGASPLAEHSESAPGEILSAQKGMLAVACGRGVLQVSQAQLPGGRPLAIKDLLNSRPDLLAPGKVLSSDG